MGYCDEMDLLSGSSIEIPQVCTIRPVLLSTFKGRGGSYRQTEYRQHLSLISMTTEDIVKALSAIGIIDIASKDDLASVSPFDLLTSLFKEPFFEALSAFVEEDLQWSQENVAFQCCGQDGKFIGEINRDSYTLVRKAVMESNCLAVEEESNQLKFSSAQSKSIFDKLRAGRKKKKVLQSTDQGPSIEDIISAVCVRSNSYTLLNIWDLTVYQLYDQFFRMNMNYQIDVCGLRWAAWGTEPFDFTQWYKNNKEENNNG